VDLGEKLKACLRRWLGVEPCPADPPPPCGDTGLAEKVVATERLERARWRPGQWVQFLVFGRRPDPLPSFSGLVEPAEEGKIGIACSGGGIRSASFNLGALQALQEKGVLKKSRYLAAVSGGSYIAAAFCMVRKTWPPHEPQPPDSDDSDPNVVNDDNPPFFPGSPEEQYLLNRSSYLAPDGEGKAAFALRLLLGLAFNLLVIALFIAIVSILLGLLYGVLYSNLDQTIDQCKSAGQPCDFSIWPPSRWIWAPIAGAAVLGLVLGAAAMLAFRWSGDLRDFATTWSLRLVILALAAAVLLIAIPLLLEWFRNIGNVSPTGSKGVDGVTEATGVAAATTESPGLLTALIGAGSVTSVLGALFLQLRADWLEAKKLAKEAEGTIKWYTSLNQRLRRGLAYLIAALAGPALALALALLVMSTTLNVEDPKWVWVYFGGLAAAFALFYATADLTSWSLHPFYRRRLASTFALKRIARPQGMPPIAEREAGIAVERDYDRLVDLSKTAVVDCDDEGNCLWPTLLVCAAANVSDNAATPAGRAVSSFTFSPSSVGGPLVGAVATTRLERSCDKRRRASFTLPAAVAISGAALSPSMGKMTRRPLRLLMGLANVRLGVWVPNPRRVDTFEKRNKVYPRPRPYYLMRELLGLNQLNLPYLYVTDGGHYENLGAMELLRRGCTDIYCFDASQDDLDAFGDMISLARSELSVEVEIDPEKLRPNDDGISEKDCVEGKILYPDGTKGRIFYARPAITAKSPADVTAYHRQNKRFPRDPTGDQLYTGQRFEAYRALGLSAGRRVVEAARLLPPSTPAEP
jgi:Patatin-like phospholipase